MSEHRGGPELKNIQVSTTWDQIVRLVNELKRHTSETAETSRELWKNHEVRAGSEAAIRSVINIVISCADVVPGAGELASWGADILKVYEESRHKKRQVEAALRGEDPTKVPREKFNLTPDVHVMTALVSEILELPTALLAPTHAIETINQLWYDVPRMRDAIRKARTVLAEVRYRRTSAREAAKHFRTVIDDHKEK